MYSGYGDQTDYQDSGERRRKAARADWDELQYPHGYQYGEDRRNKKARTDRNEMGGSTQYSHGYQDSGYTSGSTRYPQYLSEPMDDVHKADCSSWEDRPYSHESQDSQITSHRGFSSVTNNPKLGHSSELQGYSSGRMSRISTGEGRLSVRGPGFGLSQDFHSMRGSYGRLDSSSSNGVGMNPMSQGVDRILRGQGSRLGMVSQGPGVGMMASHGVGMIDQNTIRGADFMDEDNMMAMMGPGFGRSMAGQIYDVGITGRKSRTGSSDQTFPGNHEQTKHRVIMRQNVHQEILGKNSKMFEDEIGMMRSSKRNLMALRSGLNMSGQTVGMDMYGLEGRNRTTSPYETLVGNRRDIGLNQDMVTLMKKDFAYTPKHIKLQEGHPSRSQMERYFPELDKVKKYSGGVKTGSQSKDLSHQPRKLSLSEKFDGFIEFLKTEDLEGNPIGIINNALNRSRLGLQQDFKFEPYLNADNKEMVSGRLFISGIFLARTCGTQRKEVKRECYEKAMQLLTTKPARFIMKQKDSKKEKVPIKDTKKTEEQKMVGTDNERVLIDVEGWDFQRKLETVKQDLMLIKFDDDVDYIAVLSDALMEFRLDYSYSDVEETKSADGITWFIGNLKIGDLLVGVGSGPSKKYSKRRTFSRAVRFLRSKGISQVMKGYVAQEVDLIPQFEILCQSALPNRNTERKLAQMIGQISGVPEKKAISIAKRRFDESAVEVELRITLLYRNKHKVGQHGITTQCDLFLDNIFVSSGEALKHADAEKEAYQAAIIVLCSKSADVIFNDFKRMSSEHTKGVLKMTTLCSKGRSTTLYTSNASKVAKEKGSFKFLPPEEGSDIIDKDEIIIMEQQKFSDDRYLKAFDILQRSAVENLMLLQSKISTSSQSNSCHLYLQHVQIAQACRPSKTDAATVAAAKALFELYQTQPTIQVADHDIENALTYDALKAKVDKLKEECGDTGDDDYIYIARSKKSRGMTEDKMEVEDKEEEDNNDGPTATLPVNKWVKHIIEEMIKKFASEESLEEIIFGGEFPPGDKLQIKLTAEKYCVESRVLEAKEYISVYQKHHPVKIFEILEKNDGHSGLYSIIPRDDLPQPSDIESYQKPKENESSVSQAKGKKFNGKKRNKKQKS